MRSKYYGVLGTALLSLCCSDAAVAARTSIETLKNTPLDQLLNKQPIFSAERDDNATVGQAPAAAFVITADDIARSTATNIPELLRMVPGLEVARANQHVWYVTARGFAGLQNDKILVLIDGQSVYSRLTSSVEWFTLGDPVLENIEQIEIIRGSGGTLWGSNAVNGVINIVTKDSRDSDKNLLIIGGGNTESSVAVQNQGHASGHNYRINFKALKRAESIALNGQGTDDAWDLLRGDFRIDGTYDKKTNYMLQGNIISNGHDTSFRVPSFAYPDNDYMTPYYDSSIRDHAANLLGSWDRRVSDTEKWKAQFFYERRHRNLPTYEYKEDTISLEAEHRIQLGEKNHLIWGLGYRFTADEISVKDFDTVRYDPSTRNTSLINAFIQDEIKLAPKLDLFLGTKFEYNSYSGFEIQPNIRVRWQPHSNQTFWAAISRTVRTPNRTDHNAILEAAIIAPSVAVPVPILVLAEGTEDFESESIIAYELGFRSQLTPFVGIDISTFFNQYDNLYAIGMSTPYMNYAGGYVVQPLYAANGLDGEGFGLEASSKIRILEELTLNLAYTWLQLQLHTKEGIVPATERDAEGQEGKVPDHQWSARLSYDIRDNLFFDTTVRYVGELPTLGQDAYTAVDARITWKPRALKNLEISLYGMNLFDPMHTEFGSSSELGGSGLTSIERSFYLQLKWQLH